MNSPPSLLTAYLLATPVFALADWLFGFNLRVAGLDDPLFRGVYYAGLMGTGFVAWTRPALEPILVLLESACNVALIMIHFAVNSLMLTAVDGFVPPTLSQLAGFLMTGSFGIFAFTRAQSGLRR